MPDFIRSVVAQEEAIAASAVATYDLPVNPLSFIQYVLRWQDGAAVGNTADPIADALSFISKLEVLFRGQAIMSMSAADLWFMMTAITGWKASIMNLVDAASERHYLSLIIPFGRRPYAPDEAFPASRRGELQLQVSSTAAVGTVDTPTHIIETVELVDAAPTRFLKCTTISKTPSAAGEHDVDLPIGNKILGVGLFATTVPTGVVTSRDIGVMRVLVDNVEQKISKSNWEAFQQEQTMRNGLDFMTNRHTHAQVANTDLVTGGALLGILGMARYAYLDFDPTRDGMYTLETRGRSRVHMRIEAETTFLAIRALPLELIVPGG
jgi:hypothetical protein